MLSAGTSKRKAVILACGDREVEVSGMVVGFDVLFERLGVKTKFEKTNVLKNCKFSVFQVANDKYRPK